MSPGRREPLNIWMESPVAGGKSTACEEIAKRLNLRHLVEPIENNPWLAEFYKDPKAHAFGFQIYMLTLRGALHSLASVEAVLGIYDGVISDRSPVGDRVFATLHHEAGNISDLEWETYEQLYTYLMRNGGVAPPTTIIYLDVDEDTCLERLRRRGRECEQGMAREYLTAQREKYEEVMDQAEHGRLAPWYCPIPVMRIPWDVTTRTRKEWDKVVESIRRHCTRRRGRK